MTRPTTGSVPMTSRATVTTPGAPAATPSPTPTSGRMSDRSTESASSSSGLDTPTPPSWIPSTGHPATLRTAPLILTMDSFAKQLVGHGCVLPIDIVTSHGHLVNTQGYTDYTQNTEYTGAKDKLTQYCLLVPVQNYSVLLPPFFSFSFTLPSQLHLC